MRLEAKKASYKLPWIGLIEGVAVEYEPGAPIFRIALVDISKLVAMRKEHDGEIFARPVYAALERLSADGDTLELYPTPDTNGRLIVRYYPPVVEL
jgi:hypothetical protein